MAERIQIITLIQHWTFKRQSTGKPRTAYPRIPYKCTQYDHSIKLSHV